MEQGGCAHWCMYLLFWHGKPDVNVQTTVFGCKGKVLWPGAETCQVFVYFGNGGGVVR